MASVVTVSRKFGVPETRYDAWRKRAVSARAGRDAALTVTIGASDERSNSSYGAPRILEDPREAGDHPGQRRAARLMRDDGLRGVSKRRGAPQPRGETPEARPAPVLVNRVPCATSPNQLWVANLTNTQTMVGLLYPAIVLDAFGRRIIRWRMGDTLRAGVVIDASHMAAPRRRSTYVICHSDRRSRHRAFTSSQRCRLLGVRPRMGSRGDAHAMATAERSFPILGVGCPAKHRFTHTEARLAVFRYADGRTQRASPTLCAPTTLAASLGASRRRRVFRASRVRPHWLR